MALLEIKNLNFSYPLTKKPALKDITLEVHEGDFVVVFGTTGSGKTTLLKLLKKELAPYGELSGEIKYNNEPLTDLSNRRSASEIGYVMQNPETQIVTDKVWSELAFGLENLGVENQVIRRKVGEIASFFGINEWFRKSTFELSGGQKQLLNLASIMVIEPKILLLDEPTSQLDPIAASEFIKNLQKINEELGLTIIIVEHRLEDVYQIANKVVVMDEGKIIEKATPKEIGKTLNHDRLMYSLPSAVRIYNSTKLGEDCPITVRDGKSYLSKYFKNNIKSINQPNIKQNNETIIDLKDVWFRYQKNDEDIIRGIKLKIKKGEIFSLVGGNGSGKTTLLKLIGAITTPYNGSIMIDNKNIKSYKRNSLYNKLLAILPQNPKDLFLHMTVRNELEDMLDGKEKKNNLIDDVVNLLELENLLDQHPYDLSGGEQQRVALSKILLLEPKIILLDEPTKGLDGYFKRKLINIIKSLQNKEITIFIVTHDIEFASKVSDECAMIFDGEIISKDNPHTFFSGNNFYTTAANRISRHMYNNLITVEDVLKILRINGEL